MFSRTHFIIFTLIFIAFGYLFYLNPNEVEFSLFQDHTLSISPALIAFAAFIIGSFFVFLVTLFVDARRAFQLWRSSKSERREDKFRERYSDALEEMLRGNIHQARDILTKILEKRPQHMAAYISLANLYSLEGKYAEAIDILTRAKAVNPENLELLFDLVKNNAGLKRYPAALEMLESILSRDPSNREALRKKRDIHIIMGSWDDAYQTQRSIVKYTKEKEYSQSDKRVLSGMEYKFSEELAQRGEFKEAEKSLKEIIKEDSAFYPAYVSLGDVLQRQGSFDEAANTWRKAYEASWNPVFLERMESLFLSMANPQKALDLYREYMGQRPEDSVLRFFFSRLLIRLEMVDEAIEQLRDLEMAGVLFPELFILTGQAYHRRGDFAHSMEAYEKALDTKKFPIPAYQCSSCGNSRQEWAGFCESCHSWGTFSIRLQDFAQKIPAIPFYNFPSASGESSPWL
ncbi:MAG TPA: tetratricopeptide repeat protein [Thermodesulfobacteriota bacterium]|nr:tetratricopeptide repeat protein [Thermodesulfobacteriota bacterium]